MSEAKLTTMMNQLSSAYSDEEVAKNPQLQKIILEAAQELEKTEDTRLVATKLCQAITLNYLENKEAFPKALLTLYYQIKHDAVVYQGIALSAMMLPLWF